MNNTAIKRQSQAQRWFGVLMLISLVTMMVLMFAAPHVAFGADPETNPCGKGKVKLNVKLGTTECISDITQYTKIFYNLFIGVIGIFAAVMIMYAGFQWISASGNSQKIERAKDSFTSAIIGVVIALISYVLLNLINPMIVNLQPIALETITGQATVANMELCKNMLGDNWSQQVISPNASCGVPNNLKDAQGKPTGGLCYGHECGSGTQCFNAAGVWSCGAPEEKCEDADSGRCAAIDAMLSNRDEFGCIEHENKCVYGPIIPLRQGQGTVGVAPNEYERINCETSPEGVCWKTHASGAAPTKCNDYSRYNMLLYCTNNDRAVQGAQSVCVHRVGSDPPEYYLWTGEAQGDDISIGLCAETL
ncbi:MAG: pilin [Patescibacteria group bacterium]